MSVAPTFYHGCHVDHNGVCAAMSLRGRIAESRVTSALAVAWFILGLSKLIGRQAVTEVEIFPPIPMPMIGAILIAAALALQVSVFASWFRVASAIRPIMFAASATLFGLWIYQYGFASQAALYLGLSIAALHAIAFEEST